MTIIQPNKFKDVRRLVLTLSAVLFGVFFLGVYLYLHTVGMRHDLTRMKQELEDMRVENAELKESYYSLVDADNLEKLAAERGLIQDKSPQWAFASQ